MEIDKSSGPEKITYNAIRQFQRQFNNQTASSIFSAFGKADTHGVNGEAGSDNMLTGDEINAFYGKLTDAEKQEFEGWHTNKYQKAEEIINKTTSSEERKNTYNQEAYQKAVSSINVNNIEEFVFHKNVAKDKSFFQNLANPRFFNEDGTPVLFREKDVATFRKNSEDIRRVMQEYCKAHGIDTSELDKKSFNQRNITQNNGLIEQIKTDEGNLLDGYASLIRQHKAKEQVEQMMDMDYKPYLQNAINAKHAQLTAEGINPAVSEGELPNYYTSIQRSMERNIQKLEQEVEALKKDPNADQELIRQKEVSIQYYKAQLPDLGNGKFDKLSMQATGNCWAVGGEHSMNKSEFGSEFLYHHFMKDNEKHLFAVHLQEAEDNNLPEGRGDGIYVFTEKEVVEAQRKEANRTSYNGVTEENNLIGKKMLATGEGDAVAYALAIESYLEASKSGELTAERPTYSTANKASRFYEIVTGLKAREDNDFGYGVTEKNYSYEGLEKEQEADYHKLYDIAESRDGAIVLGIGGHAFYVTGVLEEGNNTQDVGEGAIEVASAPKSQKNNACLIVEESNLRKTSVFINSKGEATIPGIEVVQGSYPLQYKISLDAFKHVNDIGVFRWNK